MKSHSFNDPLASQWPSQARQFKVLVKGLLVAGVLSLSACGGEAELTTPPSANGTSSNTGSNTSGVVAATGDLTVGPITGFGSVIVNGIKYDDSTTSVSVDSAAESATSQTTAHLKLGMQVELKSTGGAATEIVVVSSLRGQISAIDLATTTLTVLGQKVIIDTSGADATLLEGFGAFADFKVNDWIEVHAQEAADGSLKATRIERESAAESTAIKLAGKLTNLDATAKTFKVGSTTINYTNSAVRPAVAVLANDQRVYVFSNAPAVNGVVNATKIRIKDAKLGGITSGNIAGLITDFVSASDFKIGGVKIDATNARFENGAAADLVNGAAVRVKGTVKDGVMIASSIEFKKKEGAESAVISVKGTVTNFVSSANFKLRGQVIDASAASFEGGKISDLGNGSLIELSAQIVNGQIKAVKVKFLAQNKEGSALGLVGLVQNFDKTAQTLTIAGTPMKLTASTVFAGGLAADLANNKLVEVVLEKAAGVYEVRKVTFKAPETLPIYLRGTAYDVTPTSFKLAGVTVKTSAQTTFSGGLAADLVNGAKISVQAKLLTIPDPQATSMTAAAVPDLFAVKIEINKRSSDDASLVVEGSISDFVSIGNLRVAGQRVDASSAVIEGGVAADLVNGKSVKVTGVIEAGILKATKLVIR